MSKPWPNVRLGEVLRHRKEFVTIDDLTNYRRPRVRLHAQGIVPRDELPGALIKTKTQQVCRSGEFLVAEIDAKVGGFGIVPDALEGSIVSSHYFLFGVDDSKLHRRFLDFYIRTPMFREQVEAQGSTNYAAIRPSHVLTYEIPLPTLEDQDRVVSQLEKLSAQIDEAHNLRLQSAEETSALIAAETNALFAGPAASRWKKEFLGEIAEIRSGVTLGRQLTGPVVRLPYLRVANVQDGHLDLGEVKEIEVLDSEAEKWSLKRGDLLLTEGGDWDKLGRGTVWREEIPNCIIRTIFSAFVFTRVPAFRSLPPRFSVLLLGSRISKKPRSRRPTLLR